MRDRPCSGSQNQDWWWPFVASFVWMLLTEPTYNRTRLTALAWRARNLSQKAPPNLSPSPHPAARSSVAFGGRLEGDPSRALPPKRVVALRRVQVRLQQRAHEAVDRVRLERRGVGGRAAEPLVADRCLHLLAGQAAAIDLEHIDAAIGVGGVDDLAVRVGRRPVRRPGRPVGRDVVADLGDLGRRAVVEEADPLLVP